jgi:hypothetical protein
MMKKEVVVRPITIKVIDDKTNEPLAGILVYRVVEAVYGENRMLFGLLPKPEPKIHDRVILTEEGKTDEGGNIVFAPKVVYIKKKEILYKERVFINLEPNLDEFSEETKEKYNDDKMLILNDLFFGPLPDEGLINPNDNYKGVYIFSPEWEIRACDFEYDRKHNLKSKYFDKLGISEGILKEEENIVVKLRHKKKN